MGPSRGTALLGRTSQQITLRTLNSFGAQQASALPPFPGYTHLCPRAAPAIAVTQNASTNSAGTSVSLTCRIIFRVYHAVIGMANSRLLLTSFATRKHCARA